MSERVTGENEADRPARHRPALPGVVARLAAAGDHATICRMVMNSPPASPPPRLVADVLDAALETRNEPAIDWALAQAAQATLPPRLRLRLAWRLMRNQRPVAAMDMLSGDPTLPDRPECIALLAGTCAGISVSALAPASVRAAAGALSRRCLRVEAGAGTASRYRYSGQAPCPSLAPAGGIGLAEGVPPEAMAAVDNIMVNRAKASGQAELISSIVTYRNVLVDRWGRIWRRDGTVLHHNGPLAGRLPARDVPDAPVFDTALLAAGNTNNPYHWFGGMLPSLAFRFEPGGPDLPILIRADSHAYHAASLRMIGGPDVPLLEVAEGAFVRELVVASGSNAIGLHPGGIGRSMFDRMIAAAGRPDGTFAGQRIFISRRDAERRRAANEAEVEQVYIDRGFTSMTMRGTPLDVRIRMMQEVSAVAGVHGAGMTIVFAGRPGTPVHEILPWMPNSLPTRVCMAVLSGQFGLRHRLWVEPCDEARAAWAPQLGPLAADLDAFLSQG